MNSLASPFLKSPLLARTSPFLVFVVLTGCQSYFGQTATYWLYLAKTLLGALALFVVWPVVSEMRWRVSWEAGVVGVIVFTLWIGLNEIIPSQNQLWVKLGLTKASAVPEPVWNPFAHFGNGAFLAWFFVIIRILGSALVVPPLEEVFYRSFLYRWLAKPDFEVVQLGQFLPKQFLIGALVFGLAHNEWLAGMFCGAAYQGLVCWKGRLGDAMTAHAVTNLLLGLWVVSKGAWHFW